MKTRWLGTQIIKTLVWKQAAQSHHEATGLSLKPACSNTPRTSSYFYVCRGTSHYKNHSRRVSLSPHFIMYKLNIKKHIFPPPRAVQHWKQGPERLCNLIPRRHSNLSSSRSWATSLGGPTSSGRWIRGSQRSLLAVLNSSTSLVSAEVFKLLPELTTSALSWSLSTRSRKKNLQVVLKPLQC